MAKKITIQHLYTTGTTAAPAASALTLGEIAISAREGKEGIYFKNTNNDVIGVLTSGQTYELVEKATSGITTDGAFQMHREKLASEYNDDNKNDVNKYGHVLLHNGDLSGVTSELGVAAGIGHTHGQYLTNVTPGSGQPIVSIIEDGVAKIGLTTDITNQINSGATAYGWGNHANEGYAKNTDLTTHTNSGDIHVTAKDKNAWDKAKDDIDAFMAAAESGTTALDTLKEIQDFLTSDDGTVQTLLDNLSGLTDTVSGNTDDITILKQKFEGNGIVSVLQTDVERKVETIDASGNLNAVTGTTTTGVKKYTITHTAASTQNSAITATNNPTGLSFGSEFKIVDNIGYDANGHVVSGSTQTMKLPIISVRGGLTGTTGTDADGESGYIIGHKNSFNAWNGKSTGITLNFNESFKIPIIDYEETTDRYPNLSGVDETGHLKNNGWTLTTFSLPNTISCGTY
jgi:hypothetical protein